MKPKLLFLYELSREWDWNDGLYQGLQLLKNDYDLEICNVAHSNPKRSTYDFVFGLTAADGKVYDMLMCYEERKGLYLAGCSIPLDNRIKKFDVIWYESNWVRDNYLKDYFKFATRTKFIKCFGVNSLINKDLGLERFIDYLGVGSLSNWKRWEMINDKKGVRLVVGEYQKDNEKESLLIARNLMVAGTGVMPLQDSQTIVRLMNMAKNFYMPANVFGGGERCVLEARLCGCNVIIEDNPKLQEYLDWNPIPDQNYVYQQLKKGIDD